MKVLPFDKGTQLSLAGEITFHQVGDDNIPTQAELECSLRTA